MKLTFFNIAKGLIFSAIIPRWNDGMAYIRSKHLGEMDALHRYEFLFRGSCDCEPALEECILRGSELRDPYPIEIQGRVSYTADDYLCIDKQALPDILNPAEKYFLTVRGMCAFDWLRSAEKCGFRLSIREKRPRILLKYLLSDLWKDRSDSWIREQAYFWHDSYPGYKL